MNYPKEFLEAGIEYVCLANDLGPDHPLTDQALAAAMKLAPQDFMGRAFDEFIETLRELDMLPAPCGYNADGVPVYSLDDLAKKNGRSHDEIRQDLALLLGNSNGADWLISDEAEIHRTH
ncbi:MAG TPA: hypothetical protein PK752_03825 [Accumulibacter sp.]|uniref:hypothetical protein n=1 Tax=Accumulibacter sp. TaxID=2053492 RepID=UPI002B7ED4D3|nr:hypothetical protein [Accumulibacter sp.]HRD87377.1 hypothetical protein [Accumulibacter sp.]